MLVATYAGSIMVISGILTATMLQAAVAPKSAVRSMFGEDLMSEAAEIVVRSWGVLVTLVGCLLVYGGATGLHRDFILIVAGASKIAFILIVLAYGRRYLAKSVGLAISVDAIFVVLFLLILTSGSNATIVG